jgi:prepilin-type N-terminal cleavage/methylation domain-containing protein
LAVGFSLVELIVAMSVFLVVSAASFTLFSRHETLLSQEQGIAGMNIGMRNALSQLQVDVVNAGSGIIQGANIPAWPVGVTIVNSNPAATPPCAPSVANPTYSTNCFDQLNVVMVDSQTPPLHPQTSAGGCVTTNAGSTTLYGAPPSGYTSSSIYSNFKNGDQLLFVISSGAAYNIALLTANGANSSSPSGYVSLTFNSGRMSGYAYTLGQEIQDTNGNLQLVVIAGTSGSSTPVWSNTSATNTTDGGVTWQYLGKTDLTNSFCSADWVLRLVPINYSVGLADSSNPQLLRAQRNSSGVLVSNDIMDQVIGFKVGAARNSAFTVSAVNTSDATVTWVSGSYFVTGGAWTNQQVMINDVVYTVSTVASTTSLTLTSAAGTQTSVTLDGPATQTFAYDYSSSDYNNSFSLLRSVRVTIIGRTKPSSDPLYTYRNPFDGGAYQIRGSSIIVDPRNLTMNGY